MRTGKEIKKLGGNAISLMWFKKGAKAMSVFSGGLN
jgi:hypothetical protein